MELKNSGFMTCFLSPLSSLLGCSWKDIYLSYYYDNIKFGRPQNLDALRIYFNNSIPKKKKKKQTNMLLQYLMEKNFVTNEHKSQVAITLWVMLTSAVRHWLRIHFRKVFISLLWEIKKAAKTLIAFFFLHKNLF